MTKLHKLATFAASAAALVLAAGAGHATTFATVTGAKISFINNKNGTTGPYAHGMLLMGGGKNHFSFSVNGLPVNLLGSLTFTGAGSLGPATSMLTPPNQTFTEGGFTGSFTETYFGPTGTVGGVHLVKGVTALLSGNFVNGVVVGVDAFNPTRAIMSTFDAQVTSYASPYLNFAPGSFDFKLDLTNGSHAWSIDHSQLKTTTTTGSGAFNAVPVPEPTAWSLMLLGVGGLGLGLRRKRLAAIAA